MILYEFERVYSIELNRTNVPIYSVDAILGFKYVFYNFTNSAYSLSPVDPVEFPAERIDRETPFRLFL